MRYESFFQAAETDGWSATRDVAWDVIQPAVALAQPQLLAKLRAAALVESYHPVHIPRVMEQVWDDVDATAILSVELFEGLRHFHGLKTYLERVGFEPAISQEELVAVRARARRETLQPSDPIGLLVNFMGSEHFAGYFFARLAGQAQEPVLRGMLHRFARDEFRHADGIGAVLRSRVEREPEAPERIAAAARRFIHYGADVVEQVPSAEGHDLAAIMAFNRRLRAVCGRGLREQLRCQA